MFHCFGGCKYSFLKAGKQKLSMKLSGGYYRGTVFRKYLHLLFDLYNNDTATLVFPERNAPVNTFSLPLRTYHCRVFIQSHFDGMPPHRIKLIDRRAGSFHHTLPAEQAAALGKINV